MTEYHIDNAIQFDADITIYIDYAKTISILLFHKIQKEGNFKHRQKYEAAFVRVIANLRLAYEINSPLYYSRHRSYYPQNEIGHTIMIKLIKAMIKADLIEHQMGEFDYIFHSDGSTFNKGFSSRMWVSSRNKDLFTIFTQIPVDCITKEAPTPLVKLQTRKIVVNKKTIAPKPIPYKPTHATNRMTKQLEQYNKIMTDTNIELHIDWNKLNKEEKEKLVRFIHITQFSKTSILYPMKLKKFNWTGLYVNGKNSTDIQETVNIINTIIQNTGHNISPTNPIVKTYNTTTGTYYDNISITNQNDTRYSDLKVGGFIPPLPPRFIGISFKYKCLHRSFTEKKDFSLGGRFYGAAWIGFHGKIRHNLFINGESVCEPDFGSYHLRILYHELGIDYRDDVYAYVPKNLRPLAKVCANTLINCKSKQSSTNAVKSAFGYDSRKHEIDYNNYLVKEFIVEKGIDIHNLDFVKQLKADFIDNHKPLNKYLYSDAGLRLQRIDSRIASNILQHFIDKSIPVLPVHDSYIIQQRHRDELVEVMANEYEKVMKFKPVIS